MKSIFLILLKLFITISILGQDFALIGPPGGSFGVTEIKINSANPNIIYSITNSGFFRSYEKTEAIFTNIKDYPINKLLITNNPETIFFGDYYYGYSKSENNGGNWEIIVSDQNSKKFFLNNPLNQDIIYIKKNTNEIWRSNDEGETWYKLAGFNEEIKAFDIYKKDTSIIYVATRTNIYKSTNSGKDWIKKIFLPNAASDLNVNQMNSNVLYVQLGGDLYKSNDGGETVFKIFGPQVYTFKLNQLDTSTVYAAVAYDDVGVTRGIYKSTDGGMTWQIKMNGIEYEPSNWIPPTQVIEINPNNKNDIYI